MTNYISLISPDSAEMKFACHVFFLVEPKKQQIVIWSHLDMQKKRLLIRQI